MFFFFYSTGSMKFLNKFYMRISYTKRKMSTFKITLWEKCMFVNYVLPPGETQSKYKVSMLAPLNKSKRINLFRSPADSVQTLVNRLSIKISQTRSKKIMTDVKIENIFIQVDEVTVPNSTTCCEVFEKNRSTITIHIMNDVYRVLVNAPIINDLKLNVPPYKGFMLYPFGFDKGYNVSILNSKFLWYRVDSKNVIEIGNQMVYTPTENDVNCCLKLVCSPCNEKGNSGPTAEICSAKVLDNPTEIYPFEKRIKEKPLNW